MAFRAFRLIFGAVLAVVALIVLVQAAGLLAGNATGLSGLILPVGILLGVAGCFWAYYYALFRQANVFRGFRAVLGVVVGLLIYYLLASAAVDVHATAAAATFKTGRLTAPLARLVVAIVVGAIFYFGLVARTPVRRVVENIFSIPDLLKKLAFTLALLCIYRIGFHIPLPGLNQEAVQGYMTQQEEGPFGQAIAYFAMFTGGNLSQSTLFGLGIMPYISAAIIFQLLVTVVPALERLQKEGQAGYRKIQEYTRYATVVLCVIQAVVWMRFMTGTHLLYDRYEHALSVYMMGVLGLTCGTIFLMWLGEQIDEYGVGNGISLIIMAGIVARMPWAIRELLQRASLKVTGAESAQIGLIKLVFLVAAFVFVVAGSILITQAQRRIPIQQAKHTRGRRVYFGQRHYLPLRVNHGGVMPIIFASSLLLFPATISSWLGRIWPGSSVARFLSESFQYGKSIRELLYIGMIFFFAYFWTTVQFRPKDMSEQLRDMGHFIPGLRPGRRTADYLERVMERITYCGAAFLAVIAVLPQMVAVQMDIPFSIAAYLGGTGLLIMVAVTLDLVQRIEANLIMRNYGGFLGEGGRIKGSR